MGKKSNRRHEIKMSVEYTYSKIAYELLKIIPLTVPKKYRTRLKEVSDQVSFDRDKWWILIEELKHNCNQTEEIDRLLDLNRQWEEAEEKRKEKERLARLEREQEEVRQKNECKRKQKEKEVIERNESKARMAAAQETLFGVIEQDEDDCVDVEPRNIKTHTFNEYGQNDDSDPVVSVNLFINNYPRYNPSNNQYIYNYDSHHVAK